MYLPIFTCIKPLYITSSRPQLSSHHCKIISMETIKSALGFTKQEQSGQEPVSGQAGAGTAAEPYDQGNAVGMYIQRVLDCEMWPQSLTQSQKTQL